jgi:hypothetical protein
MEGEERRVTGLIDVSSRVRDAAARISSAVARVRVRVERRAAHQLRRRAVGLSVMRRDSRVCAAVVSLPPNAIDVVSGRVVLRCVCTVVTRRRGRREPKRFVATRWLKTPPPRKEREKKMPYNERMDANRQKTAHAYHTNRHRVGGAFSGSHLVDSWCGIECSVPSLHR